MENLTVAQLREVCDAKGIEYNSKTTKAELIEKINNAQPVAQVSEQPFKGEY